MTKNKYHWYDGAFYDIFIAPNQDKLFGQIKNLIKPKSRIIDIGCGTGRLEFALADTCESILGIDLSERNIRRAQHTLLKYPKGKITFLHNNVDNLIKAGQTHFDLAILTYVIHEVDEPERIPLLNAISRIADKIIIGDYPVPRPKGFGGLLRDVVEFIAGPEHFRNYRSYMANGGIHYLAHEVGLRIIKDISDSHSSYQIVILAG